FVDDYDGSFLVSFNQVKNAEVLCLDALLCIDEQQAYIGFFNGPDRTEYRIEFHILAHLGFLPQPGRVNQEKVMPKLCKTLAYGIAGGAGNGCDNGPLLPYKGI